MLRFARFNRRFYSSIIDLHKSLSPEANFEGKHKLIQAIPGAFEKIDSDNNGDVAHDIVKAVQNHAKLSKEDKTELIDQLMIHGLPHDYSLYFTVKPHNHNWTHEALSKLIESNPGRVDQSWDLFKRYVDVSSRNVDSILYEVLLAKLLFGEKVEVREDDIEMTATRLARAVYVSTKTASVAYESLVELIRLMIEYKCLPAIVWSGITNDQIVRLLSGTDLELDDSSYVELFSKVFYETPDLLDKETLCKGLTRAENTRGKDGSSSEGNTNIHEVKKVLQSEGADVSNEPISCTSDSLIDSILQYIKNNELDVDKSAESLLIRIKLMEVYGMDRNEIQLALAKFHDYQTHEKFGIELVQHKLIGAFCYKAVEQHNEHYLKIAHTLMTMEDIPIKILQVLILARSEFDDESALELYNEYINLVPKKINPVTRRSGSGQLTEAMMLASLYNHDREFAQLLFDMAQKNNIISDEHEVATLKKLFKVYGEAFAEDKKDIASAEMKRYVLRVIRR